MGGSPSTRRVTVVNEDTAGVIKISDNVVKRLKGEEESAKSSEQSTSASTTSQQSASPQASPPIQYIQPGMSSLEVRQKIEEEVTRVESSWKQRVAELEKQNQELWKASNEKFAETLSTMESKYVKRTCNPVCQAQETKVLKCYQENSKMPLNCSKEVEAFAKCVDSSRREALTNRG